MQFVLTDAVRDALVRYRSSAMSGRDVRKTRALGSMMRKMPERRGPGDGVTPVSGERSRFLPFGNMTEAHADELAHLGAEVEIAAA